VFTDESGSVSAELIAQGGDMTKNPSFLFSLPSELDGATYGAYYYPYLKIYTNYSVINVPPAAYVSNNYITKYGKGRAWESVAGEKRGVLRGNGIIGTEASLIEDHRNYLEPIGINSIIYRDGIGCEIYANRTAKQKPESALSSISVREVCIYIEDEIENILESYLFDNNTAQTRLEIKTLVDNFLQGVADCGGIIAFKTVMDTSNNTPEIIAKKMGVIDVFIEAAEPMDILIQRVTIVKSGQIESSGF
jgi:phage tail sheath protein FI